MVLDILVRIYLRFTLMALSLFIRGYVSLSTDAKSISWS